MTKAAIFILVALVSSTAWAQHIYRCTINGARVIQDRPCPGTRLEAQKPVAVSAAPAAASPAEPSPTASDDMARSKAYLAQRDKERRIIDIQFQIGQIEASIYADRQSRDRALAVIAEKKKLANNNLAGATYEQSLSTEMQAVTMRFDSDIKAKQETLKGLRDELASLKK